MNICSQKIGFREIIYNSLQHKVYNTGVPIQVSVYEDKIYVWNDGELPSTINKDNLFEKHASKPTNPKIAQTFFKAGYVEAWGRGFEKIKEECDKFGVPMPEIEENTGGVMIKCNPSFEYKKLLKQMKSKQIISEPINEPINEPLNEPLTDEEIKIINLLRTNNNYTKTELAQNLDLSLAKIKRSMTTLKEKGIIERVGSNKSGHWVIK